MRPRGAPVPSSSSTRASAIRLADAAQLQRQVDVLSRGQPREQRRLLEHQRRLAAGHLDRARGRLLQTGHQVEQRRLAAAGGAEQADELAGLDPQVDVLQNRRTLRVRTEHLGDPLEPDGRRGRPVERARGRVDGSAGVSDSAHAFDCSPSTGCADRSPGVLEQGVEDAQVVDAVEVGRLGQPNRSRVVRRLLQRGGDRVEGERQVLEGTRDDALGQRLAGVLLDRRVDVRLRLRPDPR